MDSIEVIFVGGIHGVGKTTYCKDNYSNEYLHVTASQLIKQTQASLVSENKQVDDISKNQEVLLRAVDELLMQKSKLVIDGHYCLIDRNHQFTAVDVEVFEGMKITQFVLLISKPEVIQQRLIGRDGKKWTANYISEFQEAEKKHANIVANSLNIKLITVIG